MLKGENIICISSIDWDFIWQGHQEIMSTFADKGNRVLFIENTGVRVPGIRDISRIKSRIKNWLKGVKGIRQERENLYIFSPLILPFPYSKLARHINKFLIMSALRKWMKAMDFSDPIVWSFLPNGISLDIIDELTEKILIYYCIDDFSSSSAAAKKIKKYEKLLLEKADLAFVTSMALYNKCSLYNRNVHNFPFAVNFEKFEKVRINNIRTDELKEIKRPIVGYIGGVHRWIDQTLIKTLADENPEWSFVFVGPIQTDVSFLKNNKNIYFLGNKQHNELPLFVKEFDVSIIPYLITDYTKNVYPTKLNEYLSMGKPVISTPLPEVMEFNKKHESVVYIGMDGKDFKKAIDSIFSENMAEKQKRYIETAKQNTWEKRIEDMSALIKQGIDKKRKYRENNWKENFVIFYRKTKGRMLKVIGLCALFYLILFKTQFLWFLAEPLRIENSPAKADSIVVFGGGVGETGSPGKSTIERARYAAELYDKGYANKIIFSSGYTYTTNDAENMKLIAISMGVRPEDIVLEEKGERVYENVVYSKEILDNFGWDEVILVSSPYNMRRVQLVFNKQAPDVKVLYVPVEKPQFYDRRGGVKLEQIRAIVHEYGGIVYYWWKGWI